LPTTDQRSPGYPQTVIIGFGTRMPCLDARDDSVEPVRN
jgi:hypothetical protein